VTRISCRGEVINWKFFFRRLSEFNRHFIRLSKTYEHAYQALAIDEHRKDYVPSLWYRFISEKAPDMTHSAPPSVEQRWFIGAHSNIGGGYKNDPLRQLPLQWIQQKALDANLSFHHSIQLVGNECLSDPTDSYLAFTGSSNLGDAFYAK
jgi:hypothetical protein